MKAPGLAALEMPWIPPSAEALAALTRPQPASAWARMRHDPGCVLLLVRQPQAASGSFHDALGSLALLESAYRCLHDYSAMPLIDWRQEGAREVRAIAVRQAWLAAEIAARLPGCDPERAWAGGLLAPLGWLALAALEPSLGVEGLERINSNEFPAVWQRQIWGLDHTALARRLALAWRLPDWLVPLVGHLGLHVRIAGRLGADPQLFQAVQLAVALLQERRRGLALPVGASVVELTASLGLALETLDDLADAIGPTLSDGGPGHHPWTPAMLTELLHLALEQRRRADAVQRLEHDLDLLQQSLEQHCLEEKDRLQTLKLAAVAELAAGAGHEINNPLAVISGQA
ncbi:MAG: HDOD domain-containing protein, partial [Gemmataceae bacterium]|nr:HDOD domain-containing protein [Gemmataceae bacterium]